MPEFRGECHEACIPAAFVANAFACTPEYSSPSPFGIFFTLAAHYARTQWWSEPRLQRGTRGCSAVTDGATRCGGTSRDLPKENGPVLGTRRPRLFSRCNRLKITECLFTLLDARTSLSRSLSCLFSRNEFAVSGWRRVRRKEGVNVPATDTHAHTEREKERERARDRDRETGRHTGHPHCTHFRK